MHGDEEQATSGTRHRVPDLQFQSSETRQRAADNWRQIQLAEFVEGNPVVTSTVLVRRDVLNRVGGFDPGFRGPEDLDLWLRVTMHGQIAKLKTPLAMYRVRPGSLSMDPDRFLPEIVRVYEKAYEECGALRKLKSLKRRSLASRYVSAAWTYLERGERADAMRALAHSWRLWPRRIAVECRHPLWRLIILGKILFNVRSQPRATNEAKSVDMREQA